MIEMTLSSRHRIRNSSPGGLRPSTLPLELGLKHVKYERSHRFPSIYILDNNLWAALIHIYIYRPRELFIVSFYLATENMQNPVPYRHYK